MSDIYFVMKELDFLVIENGTTPSKSVRERSYMATRNFSLYFQTGHVPKLLG